MAIYSYKARNLKGKQIKGTMEALNRDNVIRSLRNKEYYPISVEIFNEGGILESSLLNKISLKDLSIFCRQFAFVLGAGISIIRCLEICIEQSNNKTLKSILIRTKDHVQSGKSLSECFREEKHIPELMISLVEAGEASGRLNEIVEDLAEYYEVLYNQEQKIKKALVYPKFIGGFSLLIIIFLLTFIVPSFMRNLMDVNGKMPLLTQIILGISDFLLGYWYIILLIFLISYILKSLILNKNKNYIMKRDTMKLNIPVFGGISKQIIAARFARTLSILISSGLGIIEGLDICGRVVGNVFIKEKIEQTKAYIRRGNAVGKTLEDTESFPLMLTQMISLGEETGTLEEVLSRTSKFYDGEVEIATSKMVSSIEPIMIVVLSVIVLIIVLAMILPLTSMMDGVSKIQR